MSADWYGVTRQILAALDIVSIYREMGLRIAGSPPSAKGWLACHSPERSDSHPSAAICVGDSDARGRYRDLGGSGLSLSLFDFAARFGSFPSWRDARREFAKRAGIELPTSEEPRQLTDSLIWQPMSRSCLLCWCQTRGGISIDAVLEAGGRLALWPKTSKNPQNVIALPGYGPLGLDADPVAWVLIGEDGPIRKWDKVKKIHEPVKTLCLKGS
jgi:hypothetical protein